MLNASTNLQYTAVTFNLLIWCLLNRLPHFTLGPNYGNKVYAREFGWKQRFTRQHIRMKRVEWFFFTTRNIIVGTYIEKHTGTFSFKCRFDIVKTFNFLCRFDFLFNKSMWTFNLVYSHNLFANHRFDKIVQRCARNFTGPRQSHQSWTWTYSCVLSHQLIFCRFWARSKPLFALYAELKVTGFTNFKAWNFAGVTITCFP